MNNQLEEIIPYDSGCKFDEHGLFSTMDRRRLARQLSSLASGGAVAEWSKALLGREKINDSQKIPGSPPGHLFKAVRHLPKPVHLFF